MNGEQRGAGAALRADRLPSVLLVGAEENPALPILENLHGHGVRVTVASHRRTAMGFYSRYAHRRIASPDPEREPEAFGDWLTQTTSGGEYGVTLACGEDATWRLSCLADSLEGRTSIPLVRGDRFLVCRDKSLTMKAAERLGVPAPRTWYPEDVGIEAVARAIPEFPVVLKPCVSNGARGISYPGSAAELGAEYGLARRRFGPCIVQEFIPHSGMQYKAEVLLDREGRPIAGGVYDKPRYYPPTGGSSTLNSTVRRPDILETATKFLTGIGWWGMGDCDFIQDPRDGVVKLMEVNPRFTRSIRILVWAGLDFPWLLYQVALGGSPGHQFEYREGLFMRYLFSDVVWFLRSPERFRARPSFFWFWGSNLRDEIFSWKDPGPWLGYCATMAANLTSARRRSKMLRIGSTAG